MTYIYIYITTDNKNIKHLAGITLQIRTGHVDHG